MRPAIEYNPNQRFPSHKQLQGITMRVLIATFTLGLLAGCTNPSMQEMRASGPAKVYISAKKEDAVSKCILFAWQETTLKGGGMPMGLQPGRRGGSTVFVGNSEIFADVLSASSGSRVEYFNLGDSWASRILRPALETCL